jgi:CoA:oxalate CoA-transferase
MSGPPTAPGPLSGVRVLDLSSYLPGPFCTQILADLGAVVIKVESPAGDAARQLPGALHEAANRNKRSVVLDLKTDDGQMLGRRLAAGADVLVEGFRPGVVDRGGTSCSRCCRTGRRWAACTVRPPHWGRTPNRCWPI